MEVREAVKRAGGCTAAGMKMHLSRAAVSLWATKNRMPLSEWTGRTSYTGKLAELAADLGNPFDPLDVCPLAGQYMQSSSDDKA